MLIIAMILLVGITAFQIIFVAIYASQFKQPPLPSTPLTSEPPATIVICLRGVDPSLPDCLEAILAQTYSNFQLLMVFDSAEDPAYRFAVDWMADNEQRQSKTKLAVLDAVSDLGSLKCQAICHAVKHLSAATEIVAFVDGDCCVDPLWLRDLVEPFEDESVGATTGNRFFEPARNNLGSRLREVWNSAAIVQMGLYRIAWGGSFAVRRTVLATTDLVDHWSTAFCEDTMLDRVLRRNGYRLVRVQQLVVANKESISVASAYQWIVRQLLTSRLYVIWWPFVLLHAMQVGAVVACSAWVLGLSSVTGDWTSFSIMLGGVAVYQGFNLLLWKWVTKLNRQVLQIRKRRVAVCESRTDQGSAEQKTTFPVAAILFSQLIQPMAAIQAAFARKVQWRGIDYAIEDSRQVRVRSYAPFHQTDADGKTESID